MVLAKRKPPSEQEELEFFNEMPLLRSGGDYLNMVRKGRVFVDDSLFLHKFLVSSQFNVAFESYPRRFTKSTKLDELRRFCSIPVDRTDFSWPKTPEETKGTPQYQLFAEGIISKRPFYHGDDCSGIRPGRFEKPLLIAEKKLTIEEHLCAHPVVFFNLATVRETTYEEMLAPNSTMREALARTFKEHDYLSTYFEKMEASEGLSPAKHSLQPASVSKSQKFKNIIDMVAGKEEMMGSMTFLAQCLHEFFGRKVYILIDEYDTPLMELLYRPRVLGAQPTSPNDAEKVVGFFRGLFSPLKHAAEHVERGLITGCVRVANTSLLSDINNFEEYGMLNNFLGDFYGFSEEDVRELLLLSGWDRQTPSWEEIKRYYDGYIVRIPATGPTTPLRHKAVFNPWSVLKFLGKPSHLQNYWCATGSMEKGIVPLFKQTLVIQRLQHLLRGRPLSCRLENLRIEKEEFERLNALCNEDGIEANSSHLHIIDKFLFSAGYLALDDPSKHKEKPEPKHEYLKIPNGEILDEWKAKLGDFWQRTYGLTYRLRFDDLAGCIDAFALFLSDPENEGNQKSLEKRLNDLFGEIELNPQAAKGEGAKLSGDSSANANESLCHVVFGFLTLMVNSAWASELSSEQTKTPEVLTEGKARLDLLLVLTVLKIAMILELKFEKTAEEALDQGKRYEAIAAAYTDYGLKKIYVVGINVSRNKVVKVLRNQATEVELVQQMMTRSGNCAAVDKTPVHRLKKKI